jgi:hypothetical protein
MALIDRLTDGAASKAAAAAPAAAAAGTEARK